MTRLILVSLLVYPAVSLPQTVAATNYHEYKKFNSPGTTGESGADALPSAGALELLLLRQALRHEPLGQARAKPRERAQGNELHLEWKWTNS